MLLLSLVLSTGMPLSQIFGLIFFGASHPAVRVSKTLPSSLCDAPLADIVMIITGLLGALTPTRYKWGFFTFGCVAMLWVFYVLMFTARKSAAVLGSDYVKAYTLSATVLAVLWFVYPIIWGVADGGNVITPTSEMVAVRSVHPAS